MPVRPDPSPFRAILLIVAIAVMLVVSPPVKWRVEISVPQVDFAFAVESQTVHFRTSLSDIGQQGLAALGLFARTGA